jgi:hypothetical protein
VSTKKLRIGNDNAGAPAFLSVREEQVQWNIPKTDRIILRELAKQYVALAAEPVNKERISRMRAMNNLKPPGQRRPCVLWLLRASR